MGNLIIILSVVLTFAVLSYFGYHSEKKSWNKGICKDCGTEWEYFDTDSQGGRGYICGCGKHSTWISWF